MPRKIYYGWFVVAACFAVATMVAITVWSFGIFFKPLEAEFGWTRSLTSSAYTVFLLVYAAAVIVTGRLADKFDPRPVLIGCGIIGAAGYMLCSGINSIVQLRLTYALAALGAGATVAMPSAYAQRWFYGRKRMGLAIAIVVCGVGTGSFIFAPIINYLIENQGWRITYQVLAVIFFAVHALSAFIIKRPPTDAAPAGDEKGGKSVNPPQILSARKAMLTYAFIGICITHIVGMSAFQTMSVHFIPYATDIGVSSTLAATTFGTVGLFSILGRLGGGFASERLSFKTLLIISCTGLTVALGILFLLGRFTWVLPAFAFIFGIFHGNRIVGWVGSLGEFLGMANISLFIGITEAIALLFGAALPYVAGYIFDATGSYYPAFILLILMCIGGAFAACFIKPPATPS